MAGIESEENAVGEDFDAWRRHSPRLGLPVSWVAWQPFPEFSRMKCWILMGWCVVAASVCGAADAISGSHWAFRPVRNPEPPAVVDAASCRTPLDRFIVSRLEAEGRSLAPPATRQALIRRVTLDLTGLPPSADEVEAFVADDSGDAYARLVDRLLESPHYGEHWGRHWLDVVRYADTAGETADYPVPVAWRYRNYVIQAFNSDKPYDEFLREQVAGDLLARNGPRERYAERVTATGFLAISRRFGFDSENYHHLTIQDTIDTLGQSVLGLTLGCARCHDHKFDPVPVRDYYALYGIFDSTRYAFPGSEQKQRIRALVPLIPPEESGPRWAEYERQVATSAAMLERRKVAVPSGILRSLDDLDGDFELQAPAAGGSKGVLVPPWVYDGPIAVSTEAQSPFRNVHPAGRVGASVAGATNGYRIAQSLHPERRRGSVAPVFVNLDFRIAPQDPAQGPALAGRHRFWLGSRRGSPAVEVLVGRDAVVLRTGTRVEILRALSPGAWNNLQLEFDLRAGTVSGHVGTSTDSMAFPARPLSETWDGVLDHVALDSRDAGPSPLPPLMVDNLAVQEAPLPPVSTTAPGLALAAGGAGAGAPEASLEEWVGIDGDFELQDADTAPAAPWHPGPGSAVKVRSGSQSPFRNGPSAGSLGLELPGGTGYQGFGQTLSRRWDAKRTDRLFAGFDFRCRDSDASGDGSWRYYLGHGAGPGPAVELFINRSGLFRRSRDARERVCEIVPGTWYQVRLELDLKSRRYTGSISSGAMQTPLEGLLVSGWDGIADYTFVDSYGHLPGVRPVLDLDNFVLQDAPVPGWDPSAVASSTPDPGVRRARVQELRRQQAARTAEAESERRRLETLIAEGPVELAYGVSEGTPRNSRIQLRGEPDKPGEEVPRGFLRVLGGGPLPAETEGSGRLELAEWLASPSNPLTARVMVNRIWEYHFGQGLVGTPNDFGTRGRPPTHPELLDYLATEFVRSGWSIKAMHRLILSSAVYRQQSQWTHPTRETRAGAKSGDDCPVDVAGAMRSAPASGGGSDAEGFSPFPRRRLGAEETRDAILLTSGELDPTPGGAHPFPSPTQWGFTQHGPFNAVYDHHRRSVYLMTQRIRRHPFLALFDGADPNSSTPMRRVTTVPTQALYFLNDPFVHASARALADRILGGGGAESAQVMTAYRRVLGRNATAEEASGAAAFLESYRAELAASGEANPGPPALAALVRVLFGSNEFLTVD